MARKDWTIEYINSLNFETLVFVAHWLKKKEDDQFEYLGSMLGTNWDKEKIKALNNSGTGPMPDKFLLPISYLLATNLKEMLTPTVQVGDKEVTDPDSKIRPLTEMPKEEFLERYRAGHWG